MSTLSLRNIKQLTVNQVSQPITIGGINLDNSDALITISDGVVALPETTTVGGRSIIVNLSVDGGYAASTYLSHQKLDGGSANG